jgi:hypothetical protein
MSHDPDERAVAAAGWRWMPGMKWTRIERSHRG